MIELQSLRFGYPGGFGLLVPALSVARGEKVAIVGPSGSGKTTLLMLIAGVQPAAAGLIEVDGVRLDLLNESARRRFRQRTVGFIFQEFELIEHLSVAENIRLPYLVGGGWRAAADVQALTDRLVRAAGLENHLRKRPRQLSHGERQRVAVCRGLVTAPRVVLADEPTGSLDPRTAQQVMELLMDQVSEMSATLIVVTHDHSLLKYFDRVLNMAEFQ